MTSKRWKQGDYADYTWPELHGGESVRVLLIQKNRHGWLVRLHGDLKQPHEKTVKSGRLHICGESWLREPTSHLQAPRRRYTGGPTFL